MAVVPGAGSSYPSGAPIQYAPPKATSTSAPSTSAPATTATQTTAQAGATPAAGDRQAAIAAITKEAARLQGEVNRFAAREAETKVTTSSGGAKDNESRTGKDITDMRAPNYAAPTRDLSYIDDYMERLQARRQEEMAAINQQFDVGGERLGDQQTRETGSTSAGIARAGGYLGGSASGTGVMLNLAQTHRLEMNDLEAKRRSALNEAAVAYEDKMFDLARMKVTEAREIENEAYKRQQDFFSNTMEVMREQRLITNTERDDARSVLTNIISNSTGQDWNDLSPETQATLTTSAETAGYPLDVIKNMLAKPKALAGKLETLVRDAAKKGAPESILEAISSASSYSEAAAIASPYIASGGGDGSLSNITIPTYDEFVIEFIGTPRGQEMKQTLETAARVNYTPEGLLSIMKSSPDVRGVYDAAVAQVNASIPRTPFTASEKKKLEQAGLLAAPRQQQLDHLYGESGGDTDIDALLGV